MCPHKYFRDVETCPICEPEDERAAALVEVQRLTRELEAMRETMHTQADVAQQRILTLEVENLRLKRLLSPVEDSTEAVQMAERMKERAKEIEPEFSSLPPPDLSIFKKADP